MYQREKTIIFLIILLDYAALNGIASLLPALLLSPVVHANSSAYFITHAALGIGMSITVYAMGQSVGSLFWGKCSDRRGRKPILQMTIVLNVVGLLISYFSIRLRQLDILLLGRFLSGLAAGNVAIASSVIADISTKNTKAIHYRIIQMAIGLGLIAGPMVISLCHTMLNDNQAMQMPLLLFAILQSVLLLGVICFFRETNKQLQLIQEVYSIKMTITMRWALIVWAVYISGLMLFGQFLPSILQQNFSYSVEKIAHYLLFMGVIYVICQFFLVKYLAFLFSSRTMVCCFLLGLSGCVLIFSILTTPHYLWVVSIGYYIFLALLMPNLYAVTSDAANETNQGYWMGKVLSLQGVATVMTSLVGGIFLMINVQFIMFTAASLFFLAWGLFVYKRGEHYALV